MTSCKCAINARVRLSPRKMPVFFSDGLFVKNSFFALVVGKRSIRARSLKVSPLSPPFLPTLRALVCAGELIPISFIRSFTSSSTLSRSLRPHTCTCSAHVLLLCSSSNVMLIKVGVGVDSFFSLSLPLQSIFKLHVLSLGFV
eukprot:c44024_g1_i1 orf=676-1104(-)